MISEVAQSCLTLCDPMDCSPPGSSVPGVLQARVLEWVAISSPSGSFRARDRTRVSYVSCTGFGAGGEFFTTSSTWETLQCPGVAPKCSRDLAWTCAPTHHSLSRSDSVSGTLGRLSVLLWNYGNLTRSFPITKTTQEQGMLRSLLCIGTWPGLIAQFLLSLNLLDVEKSKPFLVLPGLALTLEVISPNTYRNFIKKHFIV